MVEYKSDDGNAKNAFPAVALLASTFHLYVLTFTLNLTCFLSYVSFVPWQMLCVNESAQRQVNYDLYQPISSCPNVKGVQMFSWLVGHLSVISRDD